MSRVIHTGDTHVGYRQYHSPVRRQDYLDAFRQVIDDAVADDVDAVVHAGDLFDDRRPDLPDLLETLSILRELDRADIPFLAIVGNHEDARRGQWLDLFETLDLAIHLDHEGTVVEDTTFYGLDYVPESQRDALEYEFAPPKTEHTALVSHGLFSPFPHGDWDLEAVLEASTVDFDAVLLGDDHTPDTKRLEDTWVTYCGSTERTSASEREARGYNLVSFEDDVQISRRGLDTRDFVFLDVTLGESEGQALVRERIREADVEDAVVIVTIEGDGEEVTPADIEAFGQERGALVTRVNDRREFEDETDIEVSFANPDDAVRDRVREMGLSQAARSIDETVRELDVADSNVRSRVKGHVESLLDEPEAFESVSLPEEEESADAPDDGQGNREEPSADVGEASRDDGEASTDEEDESTDEEASPDEEDESPDDREASADEGEAPPDDEEGSADDGEASPDDEEGSANDGEASPEDEEGSANDGEASPDDDEPSSEPTTTTMEDFL